MSKTLFTKHSFRKIIKITELTQFHQNHPSKHFCIELRTNYGIYKLMFRNFIKITDLTQFHQNHPSKHFCIELRTNYGNHKSIFHKFIFYDISLLNIEQSTEFTNSFYPNSHFSVEYRTNYGKRRLNRLNNEQTSGFTSRQK